MFSTAKGGVNMSVPYWVQDSIFYEIFPDRFADGNLANNPPNAQPWGTSPTFTGFQGGDLRGIIEKFDYLLDLGINALYLTPIFQSPSTHRYNTTDYFRIDPKLGDAKDLKALIDVAHRNGVHLILDGVFNHTGRGFFAFTDLLENEEMSPYRNWYHVNRYPIDAYTPGPARDYQAWWGVKSLPKFNTDNPEVRRFIYDVARYWIQQGIDGWRLDVPNEIDDDSFWEEFRQVVRSENPDAYLMGEIWEVLPRWANDTHFDGLMNYPFRDAMLGLLTRGMPLSEFSEKIESLLTIYPKKNVNGMYLMLGSHDTERIVTLCKGDLKRVKLAFLFEFAFPGAPAIYYGDEIGLEGGKDPDNRRAFPWDEAQWNVDLRSWVQILIHLRKQYPALRRGTYKRIWVDNQKCGYAFSRQLGAEQVLVILNAGDQKQDFEIPISELGWKEGHRVKQLFGDGSAAIKDGLMRISLDPWSGTWLK